MKRKFIPHLSSTPGCKGNSILMFVVHRDSYIPMPYPQLPPTPINLLINATMMICCYKEFQNAHSGHGRGTPKVKSAAHSKLMRASSPIPHSPPSLPCFCSSSATARLSELSSSPAMSLATSLVLLGLWLPLRRFSCRWLSRRRLSPERSVVRLLKVGQNRDDVVECREAVSSAALTLKTSETWSWSSSGVGSGGSARIFSLAVEYDVVCGVGVDSVASSS